MGSPACRRSPTSATRRRPVANCAGGVVPQVTDPFPLGFLASIGVTCYFDDFGNEVHDNFLQRQRLLRQRYERRSRRDQRPQRPRKLLVRERRPERRDELAGGSPDHPRNLWRTEPRGRSLGSDQPAAHLRDAGVWPLYGTPGKPGLPAAHPGDAPSASAAAVDGEPVRGSTAQPMVPEGEGREDLVTPPPWSRRGRGLGGAWLAKLTRFSCAAMIPTRCPKFPVACAVETVAPTLAPQFLGFAALPSARPSEALSRPIFSHQGVSFAVACVLPCLRSQTPFVLLATMSSALRA